MSNEKQPPAKRSFRKSSARAVQPETVALQMSEPEPAFLPAAEQMQTEQSELPAAEPPAVEPPTAEPSRGRKLAVKSKPFWETPPSQPRTWAEASASKEKEKEEQKDRVDRADAVRAALEAKILANASPEQRFRAAKEAAEQRTAAKKEAPPAEVETSEAMEEEEGTAKQMNIQAEEQRAAAQATEVAAVTAAVTAAVATAVTAAAAVTAAVAAAAEAAAAAAAEETKAAAAEKQHAEAAAEAERAAKDAEAEARAEEASRVELAAALQRREDPTPSPTKVTKAEKAAAKRAAKEQRTAAEAKRKAVLERQVLGQLHGFTPTEDVNEAPTTLDTAVSPATDPHKEPVNTAAKTAAKDAEKCAPLRPGTGLSWTSVVVGGDALRTVQTGEVAAQAMLESAPSLQSSPSATSSELSSELSSSAPPDVKMSPALLPYPIVCMPSLPRAMEGVDALPRSKAAEWLDGEMSKQVTAPNEWLEAHFALQRSTAVGAGGKAKGRARTKHAAGKSKKAVAAK